MLTKKQLWRWSTFCISKPVFAARPHEDLSLIERDRAAAYFAEESGGAQALICSEIGSEGRNFQFAQHLIALTYLSIRICWNNASAVWTGSAKALTFTSTRPI